MDIIEAQSEVIDMIEGQGRIVSMGETKVIEQIIRRKDSGGYEKAFDILYYLKIVNDVALLSELTNILNEINHVRKL